MLRRPRSWAARYGIAVLAVALALLIKVMLSPFLVEESPFMLLAVAVLVGAVFGGFGPGVLATLLGGFVGDFFFLPPTGTLVPPSAAHGLRTLLFLGQGLAISAIGAKLVSVGQRAESSARRAEESRESLLASEVRLEEAQRIARIGNWDYDVVRDEAYWSDELYRIFGFEPQEFVPHYKTFLRLVHPDDRRILQEAIREASGGAARSSIEYRVVGPGGEVRVVSTEYEPVLDDSGRMVRLVGTIQEITERRRAEEALLESEERYRVVAETASDAIIVLDEDGFVSFVNEAAGRTFGYHTDEMLGEPLTMLMPERLRPLHLASFARHVATGERRLDWRSIELPGLHKSGREISLELSFGEFIRDGKRFFTGFVRDVTERKRIEEELQVSEERFRSIIEQSPLSVQILSPDGRTLRVNKAWEELWGATFERLSAAGYNLLEDEQLVEKGIMPYIERGFAGEPTFIPPIAYDPDETLPEITANELSKRWVSAFIYPVKDEAGNIREVTLIHEDITERVRSEEALRESEGRFRSTFEQAAVGVAHVGFGGEWLRVNEKLCEIVGYTREELLGLTFQDITHPDDLRGDVEGLHRLVAGEVESYSREKRYLRKDGSFVWINLTVTIAEDVAGRQEYCISVIEDITDRKRYEQELARLASYPLQSPNPIIEADATGVPTYLNPAAEELFPELASPEAPHPLLEGVEAAARESNGGDGETFAREIQVGERFYYRVISRVPQSGLLRIYATDITERRRAEDARRRDEERFSALIRYSSDIIVILDAEGKVLYESPAIEQIMGYRPEERVGRNAFELIHPDDTERLAGVIAGFARETDPPPMTVEYRGRAKDGSWHHFEAVGVNLLRNPSVEGIVVNSRDITERKRAEYAIRQSEERYRTLFESMEQGFCVIEALFDEDGEPVDYRFVEVNPAFERQTGLVDAEGRTARELVPDLEMHWVRIYGNVALTGDPARFENGSEPMGRWFDVYAFRIGGEESRKVALLFSDITERRRYEERLRRSEERYRAVIEQMVEGIVLFDPDTKEFVETNPAFREMLGYTVEELGRMKLYDIVTHDPESVDANVRRALRERQISVGERRYLRKDGALLDVEVSGSVISYEGEREVVSSVVRDITERRRYEERLRRSEERYRAVIEQMVEGIFMFDPDTKEFVESNTAFERMFGYTAGEVRRMRLYDIVAHEPENVDASVRRALDERHIFVGERRYRRKDGLMLDVEVSGSVISYGDGKEVVCAVAHDVTERKRAEDRVRFLADLSQEILVLTEPDEIVATTARMLGEHLGADRCVYADVEEDEDHVRVIGGYSSGVPGIAGRFSVSDFGAEASRLMRANEPYVVFDAEDDERVTEANLPAYRQTLVRSVMGVPLHREGRFAAVMAVHQQTPRRWSHEEVELARTATSRCWESLERARAIKSLRQSEALYRAVVEQATENIFLVDAQTGRILEHNAALYRSLGYTPEDFSQMTLYDLVAADRESVDRNIQRILDLGSYSVGEREYLCKDGSSRTVEVGASMIHREGRQTLCVVAHDIEERKQSEEAMREVRQTERSRIARELHDNVLQDIIYALQEAQILEEISEGEYATGEIAEALRRSVEGIRAAIFELRLEETLRESFVTSMKNAVDLHRRMARRAHDVELDVADDFPRELSREAARGIIRIVQESLSNARRHSAARLVTVSLRVEGEEALIEVSDDGRGFDPGSSESGVGTYSTRQRAQEIGGEISLQSAPGSGTRVLLRVPVSRLAGK